MDTLKIGRYIQHLRKNAGLTQKELAEKLNISFQSVSKWENGDTLPDTGILLALCDELDTTADRLLRGGSLVGFERRLMPMEDVIEGFRCMEEIGALFGEDSTFFTYCRSSSVYLPGSNTLFKAETPMCLPSSVIKKSFAAVFGDKA